MLAQVNSAGCFLSSNGDSPFSFGSKVSYWDRQGGRRKANKNPILNF